MEHFRIHLRTTVKGIYTVLFLFNVGQLGIAQTKHTGAAQQNLGQTLEARNIFFLGASCRTIAPSGAVNAEANAAVFTVKDRLAAIGLALTKLVIGQRAIRRIALSKLFQILSIIMQIKNMWYVMPTRATPVLLWTVLLWKVTLTVL